jgi:hypothetical protein
MEFIPHADKTISIRHMHSRAKNKKPHPNMDGVFVMIWRRPTFPHFTAVSSALTGLTSLFGMGRGGHCRNSHLNILCLLSSVPIWMNLKNLNI